MATLTIPKKLASRDDLVVIPKKEYEELLSLRRAIPVFKPTRADIKDLERARKNFRAGKFIEWRKLKNELESSRRPKGQKES